MAEPVTAMRSQLGGNSDKSQTARITPFRWVSRSWVPALLCAGVIFAIASHAEAEPIANRIYSDCTFTDSDLLDLEIADLAQLNNGQLRASYIIIYVRENPNDGQEIWEEGAPTNTFTGPILCTNAATDVATPTTEDTLIPPTEGDTVNILGAEEASHLQYELNLIEGVADPEKRVCHTVAGNTDCFVIQPGGD